MAQRRMMSWGFCLLTAVVLTVPTECQNVRPSTQPVSSRDEPSQYLAKDNRFDRVLSNSTERTTEAKSPVQVLNDTTEKIKATKSKGQVWNDSSTERTTQMKSDGQVLNNDSEERTMETKCKSNVLNGSSTEKETKTNSQSQALNDEQAVNTTELKIQTSTEVYAASGKPTAKKSTQVGALKQQTQDKGAGDRPKKHWLLSPSGVHNTSRGHEHVPTEMTNYPDSDMTLALPLTADAIANNQLTAVPPRDISDKETDDMAEDIITGDTCLTEVAERLVREASCVGEQWSCSGRCGQFRLLPCSCHHQCHIYRTCCYDYHEQCLQADPVAGENLPPFNVTQVNGTIILISNTEPPDLLQPPAWLGAHDDSSAHGKLPEQLEIPVGQCVPQVMARLIASCPEETDPQLQRDCEAASPFRLSDVTPVTDSVTGLAFRNEHCCACWRQYWQFHACHNYVLEPEAAWMRETIRCDATYPPFFRWVAKLYVPIEKTGPQFTTASEFVTYLQDGYENVLWEHPNGYPKYPCTQVKTDLYPDTCPACQVEPTKGDNKLPQCQSYLSFVEMFNLLPNMYRFYNNVQCLYCDLVKIAADEKHGTNNTVLTFAHLKTLAQSLECVIPDKKQLWPRYVSHSATFTILLSWSVSSQSWSMTNEKAMEVLEDNSPWQGQVMWKQLRCDDDSCMTQSCGPYSVMHDGICTDRFVPYTSAVTICLMAASNNTRCNLQSVLEYFLAIPSNSSASNVPLEKAIMNALIKEAPGRFGTGREACELGTCELATHVSENGITFVVWSQTSMRNPKEYQVKEEAVASRVVSHLWQLGVRGWVRICFQDALYRAAIETFTEKRCFPGDVLRYISMSSGTASAGQLIFKAVWLLVILILFQQTY